MTLLPATPVLANREWLDPEELAAELKLPVRTLYNWRARGVGPEAIRMGRHIRYSRDAIDVWLTEKIQQQAARRSHDSS